MRFSPLVLLVIVACGGPKPPFDRVAVASLTSTPHPTGCFNDEEWQRCQLQCASGGECCSRLQLPCTTAPEPSACGSEGTCKYIPNAGLGCQCMPGDCNADGTQFCGCTGSGDDTHSSWQTCPADYPTCDKTKRRCVCKENQTRCKSSKTAEICSGGGWAAADCPTGTTCNGDQCTCDKPAFCAADGHRFACGNGFAKQADCPAAAPVCVGNGECVCRDGDTKCSPGKMKCAGGKWVNDQSDFGAVCGCGGRIQCDGTCSIPAPPEVGTPCGCGGKKLCGGGCSNLCATGQVCLNGNTCADCSPGATTCDSSSSVKTCSNGSWGFSQTCPNDRPRCSSGRCDAGTRFWLSMTDVDDEAFAWISQNGVWSKVCSATGGDVPRSGSCDLGAIMQQRNLVSADVIVMVVNSGCFGSRATISITDGPGGARLGGSGENDNGWKHCGWTMRWQVNLNRINGVAREVSYSSCVNDGDCRPPN